MGPKINLIANYSTDRWLHVTYEGKYQVNVQFKHEYHKDQ